MDPEDDLMRFVWGLPKRYVDQHGTDVTDQFAGADMKDRAETTIGVLLDAVRLIARMRPDKGARCERAVEIAREALDDLQEKGLVDARRRVLTPRRRG